MRAFTLLETLLSLTLLALVIVLVLNLFPAALSTVRSSDQRFHALTLANSLVDQEASKAFSQLTVPTDKDLTADLCDDVRYQPHLEIIRAGSENVAWVKAVRVTVRWSYRKQNHAVVRELWVHRLAYQQSSP